MKIRASHTQEDTDFSNSLHGIQLLHRKTSVTNDWHVPQLQFSAPVIKFLCWLIVSPLFYIYEARKFSSVPSMLSLQSSISHAPNSNLHAPPLAN
jgi:hypothetical protein